jgi:flagellar basal-body rod modification protein FlgD
MDPLSSTSTNTGIGTSDVQSDDGKLGKALGKDDFLKLLMAQIQFQDPMQPMADHEFVAQLATFSSLEQQMLSNDRLLQLQLGQLSNGNAELSGFIGKEIVAKGDTLAIGSDGVPSIPAQLDGDASSVTVTVRNADGDVVSTFEAGPQTAGSHELAWSGKDASGNPLPAGNYTVAIEAKDGDGNPVGASALTRGTVTGISFENGFAELLIGSKRVRPADILSVGTAPQSSIPSPATNQVP